MLKLEVAESIPLCRQVLALILASTPTRGRPGSALRTAIGDFMANAAKLLHNDIYGEPLAMIFDKARLAGISLGSLDAVRATALAITTKTVGATLVKDTLVQLAMATEGRMLADTAFSSRDDVDLVQKRVNNAFTAIEEHVADDKDAMTYRSMVALWAAITAHMVATARPLPRMLNYEFFATYSTLGIGYKLYSDAGRADEVRAENKIVHPAFCPRLGRALSS